MKKVLVIGITGGVAVPLVKRLLSKGHSVIGTVRSDEQQAAARENFPSITDVFTLDMGNADHIGARITEGLGAEHADLDTVIVCTGVAGYAPLETASLDSFRRTLEINTVSCLAVYQTCLPLLRQTKGRIIFLSSYGGKVSTPFIGCYQASKYALESLGDVMRQEAKKSGVSVVMILPGGIDTPMCDNMLAQIEGDIAQLNEQESELYGMYYRGHRNMLAGPGKLDPDEVAAVTEIAFELDEPETRYVIGDGAKYLIAQRIALTDHEMDAFAEQMFQDAEQ